LLGGAGDDTLEGGLGDDTFEPGAGNDLIQGSEQRAVYWLQNRPGDRDTLNYGSADGGLQINLSLGTVTGPTSIGSDRYVGVEQINGSAYGDRVAGNLGFDPTYIAQHQMVFQGNGGSDVIEQNSAGVDRWNEGVSVSYRWSKSAITATFTGHTGTVSYSQVSTQASGTDQLSRVVGLIDTAFGDTFDFRQATSGLQAHMKVNAVTLTGGSDTILGNGQTWIAIGPLSGTATPGVGATIDLKAGSANLANLTSVYSSAGASSYGTVTYSGVYGLIGTNFNDTLSGGAYDDFEVFRGGAGNDLIDGRSGLDRADYRNALEAISVSLASGTVAGGGSSGTDTLLSVESIRATQFADNINANGFGTASAVNVGSLGLFNSIEALGGDDTITGNGATQLSYEFAMLPVRVDLHAGLSDARNDQERETAEYLTLGRDVFTGVGAIFGSSLDDWLLGGGAGRIDFADRREIFEGNAGNDLIDGREGFDVVQYTNSPGGVVVDLTLLSDHAQDGFGGRDTLMRVEGILGSVHSDRITGDSLANLIEGDSGNDTLAGGIGRDTIVAGTGDDLISGGAGNDVLSGGDGHDIASFSGPRWRYAVSPSGDGFQVRDLLPGSMRNRFTGEWLIAEGTDSLNSIETVQFGDGRTIELALLTRVDGGNGDDEVVAPPGGGSQGEPILVSGGAGNDVIRGSDAGDWLAGGEGNDQINGEGGNDTLDGGLGDDHGNRWRAAIRLLGSIRAG
jgi:Ca2+-binding RTX toxin-like protein